MKPLKGQRLLAQRSVAPWVLGELVGLSLREAQWQLVKTRHLDPTPGNSESVDLGGPQHISVSPAPQVILLLSQSQRSVQLESLVWLHA